MSIRSKAKRDANKKKKARERLVAIRPGPAIEAHAELRARDGTLLGGIARQDGEWVLGLDGRMVGGSTSAATILSLLMRAEAMHRQTGGESTLKFSKAIRAAADTEAGTEGMSLDEFRERLEQRMEATSPSAAPPSATSH